MKIKEKVEKAEITSKVVGLLEGLEKAGMSETKLNQVTILLINELNSACTNGLIRLIMDRPEEYPVMVDGLHILDWLKLKRTEGDREMVTLMLDLDPDFDITL